MAGQDFRSTEEIANEMSIRDPEVKKLEEEVARLKQITKKQELDKFYHAMYDCDSGSELQGMTKQYEDLLAAVRILALGDEELKTKLKDLGVDLREEGTEMRRTDSKWANRI
ncbi:hypothetical protein ONS95_003443 [Cadophora gregata]|uniref:uncharacterized protein n=1 Tax=Cadophora gregata TaxID=51156 RepID=UPI0026DD637B|nr:uncharacterized protein ONS95_003443 [Cadophora gregata]KAK0108650.1 hypothetical protein ONS95_003443 [Cadophora gregata]